MSILYYDLKAGFYPFFQAENPLLFGLEGHSGTKAYIIEKNKFI